MYQSLGNLITCGIFFLIMLGHPTHAGQHSYPVLVTRRGGQGRRLPPTPNKPSTLKLQSTNINFPKLNASPTRVSVSFLKKISWSFRILCLSKTRFKTLIHFSSFSSIQLTIHLIVFNLYRTRGSFYVATLVIRIIENGSENATVTMGIVTSSVIENVKHMRGKGS